MLEVRSPFINSVHMKVAKNPHSDVSCASLNRKPLAKIADNLLSGSAIMVSNNACLITHPFPATGLLSALQAGMVGIAILESTN